MFFLLLKIIRLPCVTFFPNCQEHSPEPHISSSDELEREMSLSLLYRWRNVRLREAALPKVKVLL